MEINKVSEALAFLYKLSLNQAAFRFRGQADFDWKLIPSIYRYCNFERYQTVQFENYLIRSRPQTPVPPVTHTTYFLEWLMVCQHYGVPTRLIDWTADILTGLFFACEGDENESKDGALFICNLNDYPIFNAYEAHLMDVQDLVFVSTNVVNPRMRVQSGSFMLWGHSPLTGTTKRSYDLLEYIGQKKKQPYLEKIRIPSKSKQSILQELKEIYSISSETIYLSQGYLEKTFQPRFNSLKDNIRLMTLYTTDADRLTQEEESRVRPLMTFEGRNMFKGCVSLSIIK